MKLLVTESIEKSEYQPLKKKVSLETLKKAAAKSLLGLGDTIKSSHKISGSVVKKLYLTSSGGPARAIFLLQINADTTILAMLRMKNDKQIGANMTVDNPAFKKVLDRNFDNIFRDLRAGKYSVIELK